MPKVERIQTIAGPPGPFDVELTMRQHDDDKRWYWDGGPPNRAILHARPFGRAPQFMGKRVAIHLYGERILLPYGLFHVPEAASTTLIWHADPTQPNSVEWEEA